MGLILMQALLGAGASGVVMKVAVSLQWLIFLPLAYLVGPVLGFGLLGVWILQGGHRALLSILYTSLWRGRKWQHIEV